MDEISRRIFLNGALSALGYGCLNQSVFAKKLNKSSSSNYVQINIAGGPARWNFDNPIAPLANSSIASHPMVVNTFTNSGKIGRAESLKYTREMVNGWLMPAFWKETILSSKGRHKVSQLLDNALIIRGCHMRNDGHSLNNRKLSAPLPGNLSITGLLADNMSNKLFPSVNLVANSGIEAVAGGSFKSEHDSVQINTPQNFNAPLSYLLQPFIMKENNVKRWKHLIEQELGSEMLRDYKKLINQYNERVKFYKVLLEDSLDPFSFYNIGERSAEGPNLKFLQGGEVDQNLAKYLNHDYLIGNKDFRTILKNAKIDNMAEQFSTAEILLTEGLCGNITLNINTISNLYYENSYKSDNFNREIQKIGKSKLYFKKSNDAYTGESNKNNFQLDSHDTGLMPNLYLTHALFKAIATCINELKLTLEKHKLFNKTLIHVASEFDRDPRQDCSGSEHGWNGHVSSFYSGSIKGLKIIGNIYTQSPGNSYYVKNGTWGQGAPLKENGNRPIVYGNIASSITNVLNIKSLSPNDKPLFETKAGIIETLVNEVKNIDT